MALDQLLKSRFKLESFRPGQKAVLESVLNNKDTLAVMPTGGGKSLCYQLPAAHFGGLVIVISPLIALMKDQVRSLRQFGIAAGCLHSGQDLEEKREVFAGIRNHPEFVLYLSPERVQNPGFAGWLKEQEVCLFAIDEAHCVSQWGPEFRQDYHRLGLLREIKPEVPILALTATATPTVLTDVARQLKLKDPDRHVYGFYRSNLFYQIEHCRDDAERLDFVREALNKTPEGRVLIYAGTRQGCEDLASDLAGSYKGVGFYHAGMSPLQRKEIQESVDARRLRILVATNAFGMGVDYPDVRLVIHVQMPANVESLYQEMGRAGRDQKLSRCLLLYCKKDRGLHSYFINQSKADANTIRQRWNGLNAITEYIESSECRHSGILTYFRDAKRIHSCGHCDVCAPKSEWKISVAPSRASVKKKKARKSKIDQLTEPLGSEAESRALILKDWRKSFARERDLPAFMIFSDRTLKDIAQKNPRSLKALEGIYGMGPSKIEMFGSLILKELGSL